MSIVWRLVCTLLMVVWVIVTLIASPVGAADDALPKTLQVDLDPSHAFANIAASVIIERIK